MAPFCAPLPPSVLALLALGLAGCSQAGAPTDTALAGDGGVRVICKLAQPRPSDARLVQALAEAAGMPVQNLQAINDRLITVDFRCAPALRCEEGLARLRSATSLVADITLDALAHVPRQPARPQERP